MSRSYEITIDLKATPEEVFRAVSEPEEIKKWFAPIVRSDKRVGGEFFISWGSETGPASIISSWDPPHHVGGYKDRSFAYSNAGKPVETGTARRIAVDYYIEPLGGGITRLRLVGSGFGDESPWDAEIESTKSGWKEFLDKLKQLLEK